MSTSDCKDTIAMLERVTAERFAACTRELENLRQKAELLSKLDAQQDGVKKDIERLYVNIEKTADGFNEIIKQLHRRLDDSGKMVVDEVDKLHKSLTHATDRIETNLGERITDQEEVFGDLKGDYDQKISAIKAVWYVAGILIVVLQASAGFMVKSYIAGWQVRIDTLEVQVAEAKKQNLHNEEALKELQAEVLRK